MQAIVYREYGSPDALALEQVDDPVVGEDDVLVRIRAASVNPLDWHFLNGTPYLVRIQAGLRGPGQRIPGVDVAGEVEAVGENVTGFEIGDEVFGGCNGAFAEYVCTSEKAIANKPANLSFEEAAAVPIAAFTALQALRDSASFRSGQTVLFNGASGGVGTFAVQIAKALGADVTGVCSTRNLDMVRSIGADSVIDYTAEDFTRGDAKFDVILDTVGNHSLRAIRRVLEPDGSYVSIGAEGMGDWIGPLTHVAKVALGSALRSQTMTSILAKQNKEDLLVLKDLLESGQMKPVIDKRFELADAADAVRHQAEGHARGKTIVTI